MPDGDRVRVDAVLGWASEPALAEQLHRLEHDDRVEEVVLSNEDARRHRLRVTTDRGTVVEVALPRSATLGDGAVLVLDHDRAVVVRLSETDWLAVEPADVDAALAAGHLAGHLHWRVRFEPGRLLVAVDGPPADYRARLAELERAGRITVRT